MTFDARQPFTEILTYAKELKISGASNRVVNNFIFDSYLELIKEVEKIKNENLIKTLGHSHIDNYLANHIASFTYTKPPTSLHETYLD